MTQTEKEKMIATAREWVGYCEKERHIFDNYDKLKAGAGVRNWTRFGRIFDLMLNGFDKLNKDGNSWCAMFVAAVLYESVAGRQDCSQRYGGLVRDDEAFAFVCRVAAGGGHIKWHAGVKAWLDSYKVRGMTGTTGAPGDFVVYLDDNGKPYHIGIVIDWDPRGTCFKTIEGNTSAFGDNVVPNGGCVAVKNRKMSKKVVFLKN